MSLQEETADRGRRLNSRDAAAALELPIHLNTLLLQELSLLLLLLLQEELLLLLLLLLLSLGQPSRVGQEHQQPLPQQEALSHDAIFLQQQQQQQQLLLLLLHRPSSATH